MQNEILNINGIECYEENGTAYLKLETVARGLGFTQRKNGIEYVKWERVKVYLNELNFSPEVGKDNFIPENVFYRLAMKAKNEAAEKFQAKVADEIIPSIRRHGMYATPVTIENMISNPDFAIKLLTELKTEQEKRKVLEAEVKYKEDVIAGLVEDIPLAEKRQRINQIIRRNSSAYHNAGYKWNLLYYEFEKKYHVNLSARLKNHADEFKPKLKNQLDLIDREMNMIPELYEICCKLFENDVKVLMKEWESVLA